MSIYATSGATIEAILQAAETGKVGTYRVSIIDTPTSNYWLNPTTAGITEVPAGSSVYAWTGTAPSTIGTYTVVWDAGTTSQVLAVEDLVITQSGVQPSSPSGIDLVTLADVRTELELPVADTSRNTLIGVVITAVSRAIITYCQREFRTEAANATATRKFRIPVGSYLLDLNPYDLHSTASLAVTINVEDEGGGTELEQGTEFYAMPYGAAGNTGGTYTSIQISRDVAQLHSGQDARRFGFTPVTVHSQHWGFASVPTDVKRAAIMAVAANLDRRLDAFGVSQDLVDTDVGIQPLRAASFALPTSTMALLAPYRRTVGAF